jgi:membrane associated rhomboid family serine protease
MTEPIPERSKPNRRVPIATIVVLALTGLLTGLQFVFPILLSVLRRNPDAISRHEYWRLITPLFVHADGWRQIVFNFSAIAIVGVIAEKIFGSAWWLILYFVPGVVAEIIALSWDPYGAGASIAGAGLLGALVAWLLLVNKRVQAWAGASIILSGAIVLTYFRDIHGPPILLGASIAVLMLNRTK